MGYVKSALDPSIFLKFKQLKKKGKNQLFNDELLKKRKSAEGEIGHSLLDYLDKDTIQGKNVVAIISGGNNDITRYPEMNDLALRYLNLKHYFVIKFTQRPGELKRFLNGILGPNDDITRFEYIKKTNKSYGQVLLGIQLHNPDNLKLLIENLEKNNFNFKYINEDDMLMSYLV